MNSELAKARAILDEESWIDEISILDEDGEPDDCACRVVRVDDMRDALDRIEAAAKREHERLRDIVRRMADTLEHVSDEHRFDFYELVREARSMLGAGETPKGKGVGV